MHMIYIDVPYAQKDEAKRLGARWDVEARRWYITENQDALLFSKWFNCAVQTKPVVAGDRITLKEFLSSNYGSAISLTFKSAMAFGIPYPLESGWAKKYADRTASRRSLTLGKKSKSVKAKKQNTTAKITGEFVPLCDCTTPPWEDCEHTDALAQAAMVEMLS